ncbi:hypothetical protein B1756_08060 [Natrarchaeobaculum aegyptiacum]|uniref:Uncharacterized protein n=2 Tax=Natrarchaeobaculum aegyptiacum TaxID=745377 RepID=A0A2Z2HVY5_9EURY|nr:hypothetical protein B1756_08060 [Natrarchaeobaculum aegyptiacum]
MYQVLRDALRDESLRIPILVGLVTVPITVGQSMGSVVTGPGTFDATISGGPFPLAGILVGLYATRRPVDAKRAGVWTGLAASIAVLLVYGLGSISTILATSWPLAAVAIVLAPLTIAFGVGVVVLLTTVPAVGTHWLVTRLRHDHRVRRDDEGEDTGGEPRSPGSTWRPVLACYAVAAPIVLLLALVVHPDGFTGGLLVALSIVILFLLSLVTLPALFADATHPRNATDWLPQVWLYVGGPLVATALVYAVATARAADFPTGYAQYGYLITLWIAVAVYLMNERRRGDRQRASPS